MRSTKQGSTQLCRVPRLSWRMYTVGRSAATRRACTTLSLDFIFNELGRELAGHTVSPLELNGITVHEKMSAARSARFRSQQV
jgi:hypothetical protein